METSLLPEEDLELSIESKFCHLRHNNCPSMFSLCGAWKPFTHSSQVAYAGYWRYTECNTCGKPTCPECVKFDKTVCPQCGQDRS